jgi:hypothetical protein
MNEENRCKLPKKILEECLKKNDYNDCKIYIKNLIKCYQRPKKYFYYG